MLIKNKDLTVKSFSTFTKITKKASLSPVKEYLHYNQALHHRTIFPYANDQKKNPLNSIVLSFRFRSIEFSKKRALPFFFARELLTNRKCVASLSQRNIQS